MIKLCKDCAHCMKPEVGFSKCARTEYPDPVDGGINHIFCNLERSNAFGCCGPEAKFFEPKREMADA